MGIMRTMGASGDVVLKWDKTDPTSVDKARDEFNALVSGRKFAAFARRPRGRAQQKISTFDPTAAEIVLVPALAGGM